MTQRNAHFPKSLIWVIDFLEQYKREENMFEGKYAIMNVQTWSYASETQKYKFEIDHQRL